MITLEIVAVNYFGSDAVRGLIDSLRRQDLADWRLVVVDNSESTVEADRLRDMAADDQRLVIAVAPRNLGYFGAADWWLRNNPTTAQWVAVCNADVEVRDVTFISTLRSLGPTTDILAPAITAWPSGREQNPFLRRRPSERAMLLRRLAFSTQPSAWVAKTVSARKAKGRVETRASSQSIYAPHGSFILFPRSFFHAGGSLQHDPFLYGEEITVGERARVLGVAVRYLPALRIDHNEHQATGKVSKVVFRAQREAAAYAHDLIRHGKSDPDPRPARRGAGPDPAGE